MGKKVVGTKKTTYVLTEPGQDIELVVKASSPEDVLNAIEMASDGYIAGQTEKYRQYLSGSLKKIQYLYNVKTKKVGSELYGNEHRTSNRFRKVL